MRKVILSKEISKTEIKGLPKKTLVVVHEMYDKPNIDRPTVDWQKFKVIYSDYEVDQFVLVGLNRMINPSNRCDMVNDYLQVMTKSTPKISIDTHPFIGEPWRLWYHYSVCFGEWLGVDYSYPIEGDWQKWFYYEQNHCKLSANNLPLFVKNTESDIEKLTTSYSFYEPNEMLEDYYQEAKKEIFKKYGTPKMLTNNLLKIMNKHLSIYFGMDSYKENKQFTVPNFGVYRYAVEENKRRQSIYNYFANGIKKNI